MTHDVEEIIKLALEQLLLGLQKRAMGIITLTHGIFVPGLLVLVTHCINKTSRV